MTAHHDPHSPSLLPALGSALHLIETHDRAKNPTSLAEAREKLGTLLRRFGVKGAFNNEAMPAFDMLETALSRMTDSFSRFVTLRFMARIGQTDSQLASRALDVLDAEVRTSQDGNRFLLAGSIRDIGIAHPSHTAKAADVIAQLHSATTSPETAKTLEVILATLGTKTSDDTVCANAAHVAVTVLGKRLTKEKTANDLRQPLDDILRVAKDTPSLSHEVLQSVSARLQMEMEQQENTHRRDGRIDKTRCLPLVRMLCRGLETAMVAEGLAQDDVDDGLRTLARGLRKAPDFDIAMCYAAALHRMSCLSPAHAIAEIEDALYQSNPERHDTRRLLLVTAKQLATSENPVIAEKTGQMLADVAEVETNSYNRKLIAEGLLSAVVGGFDGKIAMPALETMSKRESRGSDAQEEIRTVMRRIDSDRPFVPSSAPVFSGDEPNYSSPRRPGR